MEDESNAPPPQSSSASKALPHRPEISAQRLNLEGLVEGTLQSKRTREKETVDFESKISKSKTHDKSETDSSKIRSSINKNVKEDKSHEGKSQTYSQKVSRVVDNLQNEIKNLKLLIDSLRNAIEYDENLAAALEAELETPTYPGQLLSLKNTITLRKYHLDESIIELKDLEQRLANEINKSKEVIGPDTIMTDKENKIAWYNQTILLNEKEQQYVIPFESSSDQLIKLSSNLLSLIDFLSENPTANDIRYSNVKKEDINSSELELINMYVTTFKKLLQGDFITRPMDGSEQTLFVQCITNKLLTDLGLYKFPRQRQKNEVKHFYLKLWLETSKKFSARLSIQIFERFGAYLHRHLENLSAERRFVLYDTIQFNKSIVYPPLKRDDIIRAQPVLTLRWYKKYILQSETSTILRRFDPDKDISLENSLVSSFLQRNLKPAIDREKHNAFYRQNNFENVKAFLDLRASELKELFPPIPKNRRTGGQPPSLEDVLRQSKLDFSEKVYRLDILGLAMAAEGFNVVKNPIRSNYVLSERDQRISMAPNAVRETFEVLLSRLPKTEKVDENILFEKFSKFLQEAILIANRILKTI